MGMKVFKALSMEKLEEITDKIKNIKVALIGDLCLDVYWIADMTKSELSRETPHFPLPVISERITPGAGGNAATNIAALKPLSLKVLGVAGKDWRGEILLSALKNEGINTDGVVVSEKVITNAYCKPIRKGISPVEYEDPRIDFANYEFLVEDAEKELIRQLESVIDTVDVLCVSDQMVFGCVTPKVREKIIFYGLQGKKIVVDSRDRIGQYKGVFLKPNEVEGYKAVYSEIPPKDISFDKYPNIARLLAEGQQSKVCMTLGAKGCLYADDTTIVHVPCYPIDPPIDFCGAGDTFLSAFSCALATGAKPWEAASFANMAAEVTIKKIGTTGTASPEEIRERHQEIISKM
ncbi:MAG TPA: PfkB family carbohydrate kinase [Clostridiales bacterium]|nr:PfkB family carbohydrate kinase [Clostridiales bacterium]